MLKNILFIWILIAIHLFGSSIKIGTGICSNSLHCPLQIDIEEGIKKGDKLIVKVGKYQIFELFNKASYTITRIKAQRRMTAFDSDSITVDLIKKNGKTISTSGVVRAAMDYDNKLPLNGVPTNKVKFKQKGKWVKFKILNKMARRNYIDTVKLQSSQGDIMIKTTPQMSASFVFKIEAKKDFDTLNITAHVSDKVYSEGLSKQNSEAIGSVEDRENNTVPSWCNAPRLNKTEHTVCADVTLSALDIKLAEIYGASKARHKDIAQRNWLKKRNRCGSNISCIKNAYEDRIYSLQKMAKKDIEKERVMQEKATEQKRLAPIRYTSIDKEVLNSVKKSMHYILNRDMKAFTNITDSGRVYDRKEYERLFSSERSWKKNFPFLNEVTYSDIDSLEIYKKAHRDHEHTCRYVESGKEVPCKSLEFCFTMHDKTFPDKGCLDMYYIQGKIYWEPFGW